MSPEFDSQLPWTFSSHDSELTLSREDEQYLVALNVFDASAQPVWLSSYANWLVDFAPGVEREIDGASLRLRAASQSEAAALALQGYALVNAAEPSARFSLLGQWAFRSRSAVSGHAADRGVVAASFDGDAIERMLHLVRKTRESSTAEVPEEASMPDGGSGGSAPAEAREEASMPDGGSSGSASFHEHAIETDEIGARAPRSESPGDLRPRMPKRHDKHDLALEIRVTGDESERLLSLLKRLGLDTELLGDAGRPEVRIVVSRVPARDARGVLTLLEPLTGKAIEWAELPTVE